MDRHQNQSDTNDQNKSSPQLTERERFLTEQLDLYKQQLLQRQTETEEKKLEKQADALREEEKALIDQTNIVDLLRDSFKEPVRTQDELTGQETQQLNQREMLSVMGEIVGNALEANQQLVLNKVAELVKGSDEKIVGTQKALMGLMSHISVAEAKGNHDDFDTYKEDMVTIMGKTSGLTPEQAYLLAKAQRGAKVPDRNQIETERPDSFVSRSDGYDEHDYHDDRNERHSDRERNLPRNPRADFKRATSAAIDKVLAARNRK